MSLKWVILYLTDVSYSVTLACYAASLVSCSVTLVCHTLLHWCVILCHTGTLLVSCSVTLACYAASLVSCPVTLVCHALSSMHVCTEAVSLCYLTGWSVSTILPRPREVICGVRWKTCRRPRPTLKRSFATLRNSWPMPPLRCERVGQCVVGVVVV